MDIVFTALYKTYGGVKAVGIERLALERGQIIAVLGANGSGKSTLFRLISGLEAADSGEILTSLPPFAVGYLAQRPFLFDTTVAKNLALCAPGGMPPKGEVLDALDVTPLLRVRARALSTGQRQRAALACTIVTGRPFLALDEPSSAADVEHSLQMEELLRREAASGRTIMFSTHNPAQAARIADRVLILCGGELAEEGGTEILSSPNTSKAQAFLGYWKP